MFKQEKNRIKTKPFWMGITFFLLLGCNLPPVLPIPPRVTVLPPVTPNPVPAPPSRMLLVQGGTFTMGDKMFLDAQPISSVAVASFYLDITQVTAEKYQACITKGDCTIPVSGGNDPLSNYDIAAGKVVPGKEQHPIVGVTFRQAKTYCQAQGKRLPTEIEWEYTARGNTNRKYPWGDEEPRQTQACLNRKNSGTCPVQRVATLFGMNQAELDKENMRGVYDLGANVREWVDTKYAQTLSATNTPCPDPVTSECVIRGGSWSDDGTIYSRSSSRVNNNPLNPSGGIIGFRCAQNAQP